MERISGVVQHTRKRNKRNSRRKIRGSFNTMLMNEAYYTNKEFMQED